MTKSKPADKRLTGERFAAIIEAADAVAYELTLGLANVGRDRPALTAIERYQAAKREVGLSGEIVSDLKAWKAQFSAKATASEVDARIAAEALMIMRRREAAEGGREEREGA